MTSHDVRNSSTSTTDATLAASATAAQEVPVGSNLHARQHATLDITCLLVEDMSLHCHLMNLDLLAEYI